MAFPERTGVERTVPGPPGAQSRKTWMDVLRGTAIVLVIASHATDLSTGVAAFDNPQLLEARAFFAPYRMPILLVLSGMLLQRSLAKGTKPYVVGKMRGIVWPWLLWTPVILVASGVSLLANSASGTVQLWLGGTTTWFLTTLGFSYALALGVRRVPSWLVALTLLIGSLLLSHFTLVGQILWFSAFFFVGDAMASRVSKWMNVRWSVMTLAGLAAIAFGVYVTAEQILPRFKIEYFVLSLVGVAVAGWIAFRLPRVRLVRSVEWIGRYSIVPYVAHRPVLFVFEDLIRHTPLAGSGSVPLVAAAVTILVCGILIRLRPRTPWLYQMPWRTSREGLRVHHLDAGPVR